MLPSTLTHATPYYIPAYEHRLADKIPEALQPLVTHLQDSATVYKSFIKSRPYFTQQIVTKERLDTFASIFFRLLPELIKMVNSSTSNDTLQLDGVTQFVVLKKSNKPLTLFYLLKELQKYEGDRKTTPCLQLTAEGLDTAAVTVFKKTDPSYPQNARTELEIRGHSHLSNLFPQLMAIHPETYSFFHEITTPICLADNTSLKGKDTLALSLIFLVTTLHNNNCYLTPCFDFNDLVLCKKRESITLCFKNTQPIISLEGEDLTLKEENLFHLGLLLSQIYTLIPLEALRDLALTKPYKRTQVTGSIEPLELPAPLLDTTMSYFSASVLNKVPLSKDDQIRFNHRLKLFEHLLDPHQEPLESLQTIFYALQKLKTCY